MKQPELQIEAPPPLTPVPLVEEEKGKPARGVCIIQISPQVED